MTSPWPQPDYEKQIAMCALCFESKPFDELSMTPEKELTDVCKDCRVHEIRTVLSTFSGGI